MRITVWYDRTSDNRAYIVSLDTENSTSTLHAFPRSKRRAIAAAKREAKHRNLPLVIED